MMKKVLTLGLFLLPALIFAAEDSHPVLIDGKPFSRAVLVNGVWAIPLEDIAKGSGRGLTLEPGLQLQGTTLRVHGGWDIPVNKKVAVAPQADAAATGVHLKEGVIVHRDAGATFQLNHDGTITNNVVTVGGKRFVPLADFAHAGGGVWTPARLVPGAPINLNFGSDRSAILKRQ